MPRHRSLEVSLLALTLAFAPALPARAVTFVDSGASLQGLSCSQSHPALAWGDYDGDGDLDLVYSGSTNGTATGAATRLYRNDAGSFTLVPTVLPNVAFPALAWGDFDGDADLDLAIAGLDSTSASLARIYRNDGAGAFVDIGAGLAGNSRGEVRWGDVDGDGDLDLLAIGTGGSHYYRNDAGTFVEVSAGLPSLGSAGALALGDIDGDGDLDVYLTGQSGTTFAGFLGRNDAGSFTALTTTITPVAMAASAEFADYDGDGDLDLAVCGGTTPVFISGSTRVYANDGAGNFTLATALTGVLYGGLSWGDFDGDGDPDLLLGGYSSVGFENFVGRNDGGGVFVRTGTGVAAERECALAWGDYDNDGRLDFAITGSSTTVVPTARIYRNTDAVVNAAPPAPAAPAVHVLARGGKAVANLAWTAPTDDWTPPGGLTYQVRIGTTPGGSQVSGAAANASTGRRRVTTSGAQGVGLTAAVALVPGTYYWAVQAVDAGLAGSAFTAEQSFTVYPFANAGFTLAGARGVAVRAALAFVDDDGDHDLDLWVTGCADGTPATARTRLYRNTGGVLAASPVAVPNVQNSALAWGDFDRDGDLDLAFQGLDSTSTRRAGIRRNDGGGAFTDIGAGLPSLASGGFAWGDYDQDGDLDLAASGTITGTAGGAMGAVYRNDGGLFVSAGPPMALGYGGTVAWGDLDRDGDLDLVVAGANTANLAATQVFRNAGGTLTAAASGLPAITRGTFALGDYDADGDLDVAIAGATVGTSTSPIGAVYANDGTGQFTLTATLPALVDPALAWGDMDGDGDLDLALSGVSGVRITRLARYDGGGTFTTLDFGLPGVDAGALAWGDVDGDGRLDLALCGNTTTLGITSVYMNLYGAPNSPPGPPSGLTVDFLPGQQRVLRWTRQTDATTPQAALTHDVRLGTSTRGGQVVSLPADSVSGLRQLAQRGALQVDSLVVSLPVGMYYFTVQAVDAGFAASALPAWQTILDPALLDAGDPPAVAAAFGLRSVAPNPVVRSTRVAFDLPQASDVDLSVFDVSGRRVATLLRARFAPGRQLAAWDGRGDDSGVLPAGVYLVRLAAGGRTDTRRVVLAR